MHNAETFELYDIRNRLVCGPAAVISVSPELTEELANDVEFYPGYFSHIVLSYAKSIYSTPARRIVQADIRKYLNRWKSTSIEYKKSHGLYSYSSKSRGHPA